MLCSWSCCLIHTCHQVSCLSCEVLIKIFIFNGLLRPEKVDNKSKIEHYLKIERKSSTFRKRLTNARINKIAKNGLWFLFVYTYLCDKLLVYGINIPSLVFMILYVSNLSVFVFTVGYLKNKKVFMRTLWTIFFGTSFDFWRNWNYGSEIWIWKLRMSKQLGTDWNKHP